MYAINVRIHINDTSNANLLTATVISIIPTTKFPPPVNGVNPLVKSCTPSGKGCINICSSCPRPMILLMCKLLLEPNRMNIPVISVEYAIINRTSSVLMPPIPPNLTAIRNTPDTVARLFIISPNIPITANFVSRSSQTISTFAEIAKSLIIRLNVILSAITHHSFL
jgi:hypothetical protein